MNAEEKVEYVRNNIEEMIATSPRGPIKMILYSVGHPDNEEWTLLTISEQKRILKKFEDEGRIKDLDLYNDKRVVSFEVININKGIDTKTSTDYVTEAVDYFKNEYNKNKIDGLTYEYKLGYNIAKSNYEPEEDEVNYALRRAKAIEKLHKVGIVKKYEIESVVETDYGDVYDYAICEINEDRLFNREIIKDEKEGLHL